MLKVWNHNNTASCTACNVTVHLDVNIYRVEVPVVGQPPVVGHKFFYAIFLNSLIMKSNKPHGEYWIFDVNYYYCQLLGKSDFVEEIPQ